MKPSSQTAEEANAFGEIKGLGPAWICGQYAEAGHNYITCPDCFANFDRHMDVKEAA